MRNKHRFNTNNIEITASFYNKETDEDIEFTVICDFDFDCDDPSVGYFGSGWLVEGIQEKLWFSDIKNDTPENRNLILDFIKTKKFDEIATEEIQSKYERWANEIYGE